MKFDFLKRNKYFQRFILLFKQGLLPKELAMSLSIGVFVGVIPMWGVTSLILPIVALRFKLNLPIMIAVTYVIIPLQLFIWIDFIQIGEYIVGLKHSPLTVKSIQTAFQDDFTKALNQLWIQSLCGLLAWFLIGSPTAVALYLLLRKLLVFVKI